MKIMVSACLLGDNTKYDGGNNYCEELSNLLEDYEIIKVCPEVTGGLSIPRIPSEIKDNKVINKIGEDVTKFYQKGAIKTLERAKKNNIKIAIFKEKSPSCGSNYIYDGTFSKILIKGDGITTKLLKENGILVFTEKDISLIKEKLKRINYDE